MEENSHDYVYSPVFGRTRATATEEELNLISKLVDEIPISVFGGLNRHLNNLGLCISIRTIEEVKKAH